MIRKRGIKKEREKKNTTKMTTTTKNTKVTMRLAIASMILTKRLIKRKKATVRVLHLTTQVVIIKRRYSKEIPKKAKTQRRCIMRMESCSTKRMLPYLRETLRKAKTPVNSIMKMVSPTRMTKMSTLVIQPKSRTPIKCITPMGK